VATYFADTAFWIALSSRRDQYHASALAWHSKLTREKSHILTTEAVLWEWLNALADASTRAIAAEGYRRVHADPKIQVVAFDSESSHAAIELYRERIDKDWSLTDCLSIVVMNQRQLSEALTTDRHFEQAGLKALMRS
jgi:predicted nucleic acid-binding protein